MGKEEQVDTVAEPWSQTSRIQPPTLISQDLSESEFTNWQVPYKSTNAIWSTSRLTNSDLVCSSA